MTELQEHGTETPEYQTERVAAHELLNIDLKDLSSSSGKPLMVRVNKNTPFPEYIPSVNKKYVFCDTELIKNVLMMLETGLPGYLWGHAGTGKTSMVTQLCARLNRPLIRAQHTAATEESHISGQILARDGSTYFQPGLLSMALRYGWVYLADEYDFAFPQILGVYQPVLEGEPLIIKEATPQWRRTVKHPHFSFIATGNTNGSGDETGLYQGTNIQNAANFSRFAIVCKVNYMPKNDEADMLIKTRSVVTPEDADKLVKFASAIRLGYENSEISQPIGPRELLLAGMIGTSRASYIKGLELAFINKLPQTSAYAAKEIALRIFGES